MQKKTQKNAKIFAHIKKKYYLCIEIKKLNGAATRNSGKKTMKRSNYTSKESANNMLNANGYEMKLHFEDEQIEVALYENLNGTYILTRNTKNYQNAESDTLVQVMDDRKEGVDRFSDMVTKHIFKLQ